MIAKLMEVLLPRIIGVYHFMEKLTVKEQKAKENFIKTLDVKNRKTKKPIIVALVGLVGSGKSSVAKKLAELIGAIVIEGDAIRVKLRELKEKYEKARTIAEDAALKVVKEGGNVILDSDFVDPKKRASIRQKARKAGVKLVFIRIHCDIGVMQGRIFTEKHEDRVEDFFGGASFLWNGDKTIKGAIVKDHEMHRRTPHHYRWVNKGGGKWILRKFSFSVFATIDTTDEKKWKGEVEELAKNL